VRDCAREWDIDAERECGRDRGQIDVSLLTRRGVLNVASSTSVQARGRGEGDSVDGSLKSGYRAGDGMEGANIEDVKGRGDVAGMAELRGDGKRPYDDSFRTAAELFLSFCLVLCTTSSFSSSSIIVTGCDSLTVAGAMVFPLPFSVQSQFSCIVGTVKQVAGAEFVLPDRTDSSSGEPAEGSRVEMPSGLEFTLRCS
jgi:hypothetical protein